MAKPQKILVTPKEYEVGVDISQEALNELILKLTDWFVESRPTVKEPSVLARQKVKDCLEGKTSDGTPWFSAASSTFETRIKMACRFDMSAMRGIRTADEKTKANRDRKKAREKKLKLERKQDVNIPDELRAELRNSTKYGDNAQVFLSSAEHKRWNELKAAYQQEFPELKTVNAEAELNKLLNLLIVDERQQMNLLQGKDVNSLDMKGLTDQIVSLKKALGIHPEQVAKRSKDTTGGSIAEVVARLEAMGDAKEIRAAFQTEEFLQLYQMFHARSPRSDTGGYQLDEVGLFSMTRCRTCHCAACGVRNYVGFSIEEIEDHLKSTGTIEVEEEPTQTVITSPVEKEVTEETGEDDASTETVE